MTPQICGDLLDYCVGTGNVGITRFGVVVGNVLTTIVLDSTQKMHTGVGTLIVATIYLQLIQNRYMFRSFTVLQCSHQHCVRLVASDVEVVGYL